MWRCEQTADGVLIYTTNISRIKNIYCTDGGRKRTCGEFDHSEHETGANFLAAKMINAQGPVTQFSDCPIVKFTVFRQFLLGWPPHRHL